MTDTATTVRLPHTGLRVPDRRLSLTHYRELATSAGVAFTANLRVGGRIVGLIENEGRGGMTWFRASDWRIYSEKQLEEYAGRCRTEDGETPNVENLLDTLVDEHDWTSKVKAATRTGKLQLRLMDASISGFPPFAHGEARSAVPDDDKQWKALAEQVLNRMAPGPDGWWQAWTDQGWRDVTPRPQGVSAELYG